MKWGTHIDKICKKANTTLGFLRRNLYRCLGSCKKNVYISLVRSVLEYGAVLGISPLVFNSLVLDPLVFDPLVFDPLVFIF